MPMRSLAPWRPFQELERMMRSWESRFPRLPFEGFEEEEIMPPVESYVKEGNLIVITDFQSLNKTTVANKVSTFILKHGALFFETHPTPNTSELYVIQDFKSLTKQLITTNPGYWSLDED